MHLICMKGKSVITRQKLAVEHTTPHPYERVGGSLMKETRRRNSSVLQMNHKIAQWTWGYQGSEIRAVECQ